MERRYFKTIPAWGWCYTIADFKETLKSKKISPHTGYGYFAKDGAMSEAYAFVDEPEDATHVVWFET
jgi:hypothetical protein